ncbi:MAG: RNA-binding S4 domain-containing protein [Ahrensia sp.]|nr:RNA-binding S4 domain-containing protein [Ahrensia sp.]
MKIRVDKWLWYARVVKSRSLAQGLIKTGKVRVNAARISAPSRQIEPGDVITVTLDRQIKILKMIAPGDRRGPASEARTLYEDLSPPPAPKQETAVRPSPQAVRDEGSGRPTKKQRRDLDRLRSSR